MDESEQQSLDWEWLEADTYRTGRERLVGAIRSDMRTFGAMAVGAALSLEGARAVGNLNTDAEPFLMVYPGVGLTIFGAVAISAAGGVLSELKELNVNRKWKH